MAEQNVYLIFQHTVIDLLINLSQMMDLETVQGIMKVIMTAQMISRIVITMMTIVTTIMIHFTVMKASVSASSAAAVALAVTSPDAVRRWDGSLRVYFAQVTTGGIYLILI